MRLYHAHQAAEADVRRIRVKRGEMNGGLVNSGERPSAREIGELQEVFYSTLLLSR